MDFNKLLSGLTSSGVLGGAAGGAVQGDAAASARPAIFGGACAANEQQFATQSQVPERQGSVPVIKPHLVGVGQACWQLWQRYKRRPARFTRSMRVPHW